ncbi:MAG: ABC transporter permease [Bacteroidota bacterium]
MEYEIKPAGRFSLNLGELWEYRELVFFFTWRDIKVKYKQTFFGAAWAVFQPLLLMLVFTVFFARNFKIESGNVPYPVFVFSGLLLWNVFANGLSNAGNSMVSNANIIKKIYFPRLIIPISSILSAMVDFLIAMAVYFCLLFFYGLQHTIPAILVMLVFSLLITLCTTLGVGCFLAALNVKYRDFRYVIPFLIQVLMFMTPIIYPVTTPDIEWVRTLLLLNPMTGAIELIRSAVMQVPLDTKAVLIASVTSVIWLIIGISYFRKTEYYFADLA